MKDKSDYNVRAVERAIIILNSFDDEHPERGVSEISEIVSLHKATTHRILTTLVNYGFVERSDDGQKYRLGIQLFDLGFRVVRRMDLRREAYPFINQLSQQLDEAVDLSVFDHGQVLYIEMIQTRHALQIAATVGQRLPAYCTASGKIFLAYMPVETQAEFLSRPLTAHTRNTITDPEMLTRQLAEIRQNGYSVDNEELELGVRAISAPIRNQSGNVVAAVSIPSPTSRLPVNQIQARAEQLMAVTDTISRRFGWSG